MPPVWNFQKHLSHTFEAHYNVHCASLKLFFLFFTQNVSSCKLPLFFPELSGQRLNLSFYDYLTVHPLSSADKQQEFGAVSVQAVDPKVLPPMFSRHHSVVSHSHSVCWSQAHSTMKQKIRTSPIMTRPLQLFFHSLTRKYELRGGGGFHSGWFRLRNGEKADMLDKQKFGGLHVEIVRII